MISFLEKRLLPLLLEYKTKIIGINIDNRKRAFANTDLALYLIGEDYQPP